MKTIGQLGGTGWSSTIEYYKLLNQGVGKQLGGYHSAKILLKSIDYHEIMSHYGKDHAKVAQSLKQELQDLIALKPDCLLICCNSLHKYYDLVKNTLDEIPPVFHAVELTAEYLNKQKQKKVLLLATRFTMEDGFFAAILQKSGIEVIVPDSNERQEMQNIHADLMQNQVNGKAKNYFSALTQRYKNCESVVLGCTEYVLVLDESNSHLPIVNPVILQTECAINFAIN
jgi:aspartate racemase